MGVWLTLLWRWDRGECGKGEAGESCFSPEIHGDNSTDL
jgi:hypothetical protein